MLAWAIRAGVVVVPLLASWLSVRYAYTWSEHENGTFDVDSWGRSANAIEQDRSHAVSGTLLTTLSAETYNEFLEKTGRGDLIHE